MCIRLLQLNVRIHNENYFMKMAVHAEQMSTNNADRTMHLAFGDAFRLFRQKVHKHFAVHLIVMYS